MGGLGLSKKRVRQFWSDDEKRAICTQTRVAGISVASIARRYSVHANLVFRWLKDPAFPIEVASSDDIEKSGQLGFKSQVRHVLARRQVLVP
jgi:transposase